jgi:hypothetical protein
VRNSGRVVLIALMLGFTGLTSCPNIDDLEITWVETTIMGNPVYSYITYGYSSGVRVSWIWHSKFIVSGNESGNIKITACGPENEVSCKKYVESGKTYKISVTGSVSTGGAGCDIYLESKSFETIEIVSTEFDTKVLEIEIEEAD